MFLFLKLVLAHLIADFVLQFEELYQLKVRSLWGHILHVLIHGIMSLLLVFPYLNVPQMWLFIGGVIALHLIQDIIKYTLTKKIPKNTFVYFIGDQCVHILILSVILLFPISSQIRGFPQDAFLNRLYVNSQWTIGAIFFVLLTFAGSFTLYAFYKGTRKDLRPNHGITSFELLFAIAERTIAGTAALLVTNFLWLLLVPLVGIARLPFKIMRDRTDFLISISYAILLGLLFRLFF